MTLDSLSNNESVEIQEQWIKDAAKGFEDALRRQFLESRGDFRLRASNLGKPSCQLQNEKANAPKSRMPYNHIVRMLIGDAVEQIMTVVLKAAKVNITGGKSKIIYEVNGNKIAGEDDSHIDNEVWDIKSCSPYAFAHKWNTGFEGLYKSDTFGYVEQLYAYAKAQNKTMGGWLVIDKSSGEIKIVKANPTEEQLKAIDAKISNVERLITSNSPLVKCFEPEDEYFRNKPTGNKVLSMTCTFCSYIGTCWPNAKLMPQAMSQAKEPKPVWYETYNEETNKRTRMSPTIPIDSRDPFFGVTKGPEQG